MFRITSSFMRSRASIALQHRVSSLASISTFSTYSTNPRPGLILRLDHVNNFGSARSLHSGSSIDVEAERRRGQEKLKSDPARVTMESSTRKSFDDLSLPSSQPTGGVQDGLTHDINIVKDAFRLSQTPRESHILGLMGTLPYFATSLSSVFLSWNLTKDLPTASPFYNAVLINHDTAQYLLSIIEPLQLGYGAVIISFLGAVHWGLEYAEKEPHPDRTRFRYGMGVVAPIIAWPTLLMPLEYGLITQFAAFVALYFADSRASIRGWAPQWYGHYRFLLTAMVGLALFISLVGRSRIETADRLSGRYLSESMTSPGMADTTTNWAKVEAEEKKRVKKEKEEKEKEIKRKRHEELAKEKSGMKGKETRTEGEAGSNKPESKENNSDKKTTKEDSPQIEGEGDSDNQKAQGSRNPDDAEGSKAKASGDEDEKQKDE